MEYLTLEEVSQDLGKSKKTITRYIKQGKLNPKQTRSKRGTLEYQFSLEEVEALRLDKPRGQKPGETPLEGKNKPLEGKTGQTRQRGQNKTGQTGHFTSEEGLDYFKEITELLKSQLEMKDTQIKSLSDKIDTLIERSRETNILLGQLQSKVLLQEPEGTDWTEKTGQRRQDIEREGEFIEPIKEDIQEEGREDRTEGTPPKAETETEKRSLWDILFKKII